MACGSSSPSPSPSPGDEVAATNTITDLADRSVTLESPITAGVALAGPSYEKIFMLGQADSLVGAHFYMLDRPWVLKTNPNAAKLTPIESPAEPNVEGLVELGADAVFFWDYEEPLASMEAAGLPVVVVQNSTGNPKTAQEFVAYQKREIQVFADALGGTAPARAQDWNAYFDEKVAYVTERVGTIPQSDRKTAIYIYGEEGLGVFSQYSYPSFWLELAGGRNIADESGAEMDTVVTMEQMIAWNPDFIFMGREDSTDLVTANPAWSQMTAVSNGAVYLCPDGVMYWDYSSEGVLLMEYLAQKMYPELFTDLDMVQEVTEYYQRFYGYSLSAVDAQRILDHLSPA
ncbi:MAG: ABC transporter substrate-binding protein [Coriobacteriales bacterium]|nr:ABC transporter substrate-binding protein [Coriobacteriales bacterium]